MIEGLIWVIGIGLFVGEYAIVRWAAPWLGVVMPVVWVGAIVWLGTQGHLTGFRDFIMAGIGFFVLLVLWGRAASVRAGRREGHARSEI